MIFFLKKKKGDFEFHNAYVYVELLAINFHHNILN